MVYYYTLGQEYSFLLKTKQKITTHQLSEWEYWSVENDVGNTDIASFSGELRTLEKNTLDERGMHISDQWGNIHWTSKMSRKL